jgi:hypothetical protein
LKRNSLSTAEVLGICLFGIASFEKDYRLCFFLNKYLNIDLSNAKNKIQISLTNNICELGYYTFKNFNYEYYLLENSINNTKLLPKYKNINYLLLVKSRSYIHDFQFIEENISKAEVIIGSFKINDEKDINRIYDLIFG